MAEDSLREDPLWYRIRLSREECSGGAVEVLFGVFRACYLAANGPAGMALWGAADPSGHGAYELYLTPASLPHVRALIRTYAAAPVPRPDRSNLVLLYGDPAEAFLGFRAF